MTAPSHEAPTSAQSGYTLLEVVVGLLILSIASIGSLGVINFATRQVQRSGEVNELNTLIESDLAKVRSANARLVCNDSTCSIASSDPGEQGYFPAITSPMGVPTPAEQANIDFFLDLCTYRDSTGNYGPSSGFAAELDSLLPLDENLEDSKLQRTLTFTDPSNADLYAGHRYTVTYTRTGDTTILRQVTLVPATVAWCPCVPSGTSAADLCP